MYLHTALQALGFQDETDYEIYKDPADGIIKVRWFIPSPPDQATIDAQLLPATKADRLIAIRAEAQRRILAKWPSWRQNNCSLGIYPQSVADTCTADIAAVISASNTAEDAVDAATTVAEVEAITPTWPVI